MLLAGFDDAGALVFVRSAVAWLASGILHPRTTAATSTGCTYHERHLITHTGLWIDLATFLVFKPLSGPWTIPT